jgi:hypothetical protein
MNCRMVAPHIPEIDPAAKCGFQTLSTPGTAANTCSPVPVSAGTETPGRNGDTPWGGDFTIQCRTRCRAFLNLEIAVPPASANYRTWAKTSTATDCPVEVTEIQLASFSR